jgi:hypothetical protein
VFDYDGLVFRSAAAETADQQGNGPVGNYHQAGKVVWAEFSGGAVLRGSLVGECAEDGTLHLGYCQLLDTGEVISGRCVSTPERLADGRVQLREQWRRFDATDAGSTGVSYIVSTEPAPQPAH